MSNFFDQFDQPAGSGNFFDQFDEGYQPPKKKKRGVTDVMADMGTALWEGAKSTGRMVGASGNTFAGDLRDVEDYALRQQLAQESRPEAVKALTAEIERRKQANPDGGVVDAIRDVGGAMIDNPEGSAQFVIEQAPNSAVALGAGWAGAKLGAAGGSVFGPVGAAVGGIGGFLGGMFLGNTLLETGGKAIEKAEGGFTDAERGEAIREGAVKGGVITAVDAATLGAGNLLSKSLGKAAINAGARAEARVLADAGVDLTSRAAIEAALARNPALREAAKAAGETAAKAASTMGSKAAMAGTGLTMETAGEGTGEYLGDLAATGKADVYDAVMEAAAGFSQSVPEVAWNMRQASSNDLNAKNIQRQGADLQGTPPSAPAATPPNQPVTPPNAEITPPNAEITPPNQPVTPPNAGITPPNRSADPTARLAELEILAEQRDLTPVERKEAADLLTTLQNDQDVPQGTEPQAPEAAPVEAPAGGDAAGAAGVSAEPAAASVEAAGVEPATPGSDAGNGFKQGPQAGERYRVGVVDSVGGAVSIEKRLPAGTAATFYIGADGGLVDADSLDLSRPESRGRLWTPANAEQASQASQILDEMGRLALNDPRRAEAKQRLKSLVAGGQTQPAPTDFWSFAKSKGYTPGQIKVGTPEHAALKAEYDALKNPEPVLPPMQPPQNVDLQNRDRGRAASVVQMSEIARALDYGRLGISRTPDSGAPMVFAVDDQINIEPQAFGREDVATMSDGQRVPFRYAVVDASRVNPSNFADGRQNPEFASTTPGTLKALNNGRTAGIRAAHEMGTAGEYVSGLQADEAMHGIPADVIARVPNPMLVRVYSDAQNTAGMAAKSQGQGLGMSPAELARQDAPLMDSSVLGVYQPGDVTSAGNRDFVRAFMGKLTQAGQDVAGMMTGDGQLSQDGRKRIQAALMQAAYGDSDIVEEMFDSTDTDIKAIGEALKTVAGQWANMRDSAKLGAINPQTDITDNLLQAIGLIRKARRDNTMVYDLVQQPDLMTGETPDPETVGVLRMFYTGQYMTRAVGKDRLTKNLGDYITAAMVTTADAGMFGDVVTPADILATIEPVTEGQGNAETQPQESSGQPVGGDVARVGADAVQQGDGGPGADEGGTGSGQDRRGQPRQDAPTEAQQQVGTGDQAAEEGNGPAADRADAGQQEDSGKPAAPARGRARKAKGEGVKPEAATTAEPEVKTLPSAGTFKSWSNAVPKLGTVNGWTLFRDSLDGIRYVLMTSFNSVGFDTEQAARDWAAKNKATKGDFNEAKAKAAPAAPTTDEKRKVLDESLKAGTISVEDYMKAAGLTDEDTGPIGNGLRQQADRIAKERSPYHQAINKIHEALSDQMRKAMEAPVSTPPQRKAKEERIARINRDRDTLDMIARNFEHPFQNTYVTKLSPNLRERFENRFSKIQTGFQARDAFNNDSYSAWADLLIEAANKKQAGKRAAAPAPEAEKSPAERAMLHIKDFIAKFEGRQRDAQRKFVAQAEDKFGIGKIAGLKGGFTVHVADRDDGNATVYMRGPSGSFAEAGTIPLKDTAVYGEKSAEPLLTNPTREDVLAQQTRAETAEQRDEREQIRRESEAGAGMFTLEAEDGRQDTTGNLFSQAEPASETAPDDGITIKPGKGLIKGKFLAEVDGDGVPGGPWDTEAQARTAAEAWKQTTADRATENAAERARRDRIAEKFRNGEPVSNAEIESLGLKTGTSDMRWFMSTAANLFGLNSRDIRPIVKDLIRTSLTDMGAKREFVPTRQALEAIAKSQANQKEADTPATTKPIEDFGEKLGGARKDRAPSLSVELTDADIATKPFSQIWPAAEIDGIEDKFAAAVAYAARAEVPAKPRVAYKVKSWVEKVKVVRGLAQWITSGKYTPVEFMDKLRELRGLKAFGDKVELLAAVDRGQWGRIGSVEAFPDAYRFEDGGRVPSPFTRVEIDGKIHNIPVGSVIAAIEHVDELLAGEAEAKKMQFEIRQSTRTKEVFINKKGDKEYRKLKTFTDVKDARAFIKDNYDDLVAAWEAVKESDNVKKTDVRTEVNRPRTGADRRGGKDVTPEQFGETFGFRGVEFGNWVGQGANAKERQGMLNQAFDALMDLAEIVGIPPRAISLNGSMGLAFGSRGSGKAAAHFEPSNLVINLTKTKGAGSLAHEWFHALDNYFARQRGGEVPIERGMNAQQAYRTNNYITYRPEPLYIHRSKPSSPITRAKLNRYHEQNPKSDYYNPENWKVDPKHPEGVRPEVERAFADLVKALDESPMAQRAASLDKGPDGYWSRIIERGARAFENYVITKMMEKGYQNDYLANVRPVQDFTRSMDRYPYLLPEEVAPIAEAFDTLFGTIETRETEQGVAMFSRGRPGTMTETTVRQVADTIAARWTQAPTIIVVPNMQDMRVPEAARLEDARQRAAGATGVPRGFYHRGTVYLVADGLKSVSDAAEARFHEALGHYGLRAVFGAELLPILDQIAMARPDLMRPKAEEYGKNLTVPKQRREVAEEVLAEMAQTKPNLGFVKRAIAAIRTWLRQNVPAFKDLALTDAEIINNFILPARGWVERGERAMRPGGKVAFLRVKDGRIRRTVQELVDAAESQKNWRTWYQRHEDVLGRIFGDDADLFQQILSATSQATGVKGNVTLALKAYEQMMQGQPFDGFLPAVKKNLERIAQNEALRGAKISQYGEANDGNTDAIAVDRHIAMLFFNTKTPTRKQIESAKRRIRAIADRLGWEPRQVQAALWAYNQVRLGTDPEKVESYDRILEAKESQIQSLRAALRRREGGSVRPDGQAGRGIAGREADAGRTEAADGEVAFSRTQDQTQTDAFKRWFGDSKVVDAEGRPLVVYHGTQEDFTVFDREKLGSNTKHPTNRLGFYFVGRNGGAARMYSTFDKSKPLGRVIDAYLSLKNPIRVPAKEFYGLDTAEKVAAFKEKAEQDGHDGVIIDKAHGYHVGGHEHYIAFRPEQIKSATGNNGNFDPDNADIRFSRSTLGNQPPQQPPGQQTAWQKLKAKALELTSPEAITSLIYELQDKNIDLKNLRDHIRELGGTITDLNDAYLGEELYHKRLAKRTQDFLSEELKPLLADLRARGLDLPTLETYLHARHAPEANRVLAERNPNAQMIDAGRTKAKQDVKALEVQLQRAQAQGTATKAIEQALELAREELSRWTGAQAFKGTEEERLSLSGMSDQAAADFVANLKPGQKVHLDALAARVDAMNAKTLDTLEKYGLMEKVQLDGWRNTYQHYVPLHRDEAHPDAVSHPIGQGFSTKGDASKRRAGSNEKVTNILAHIAMQREAALTRGEKNRVAKKLYLMASQNPDPEVWSVDKPPMTKTVDRETGFVRTNVDPTYKNKPNVVMVRIGGRDQAIVFNERNPQAVRLAQSIKNADVGDLNAFDSTMGKATRWLASVNTQYNPIFGIINFARDVQAAILQLSTTPLKGQERAVAANVPAALKGIYAEVRSRRKGQGRGQGQWAKLWEEMQDEGGTTGYRDLFIKPEERAEALVKELNSLDRSQASEAAHAVVDWLSDYNETMENAVRLSAYKVALDRGMSKERAASLAKNLTVNFNRRGRQTAKLGAYYAFLNAAIQGTARMAETLRGPAGKKIMLGGVMLGAVNTLIAMTAMGAGDDDDNWEKIPDFVKERSLIVPLGREDYLAIPMPLGYHVLPNMGRKAVEMMLHDDPTQGIGSHITGMLRLMLDAFNPLGGSENLAQMLAPTPFDPAMALIQNRDWTGKPIYREDSSSLDPTPGHTRTKDTASTFSKAVSEAMVKLTGGTDYQPGAINWTPDQIDYVIGQLTGGLGRELMKVEQTITAPFDGEELPPHKIPLVGRIYGNTRGPASESEKFYENLTKLNGVEREIKGRARDGEDYEAYMAEEPLADLVGLGNSAQNHISKLRQARREVVRQGLPGYQDEVKELNSQIGDVMKTVNQEVKQAKQAARQ